jgi:hypothetical protein
MPRDLYEIKEGRSYPVDYMRYQYLGRLFLDAFSLYQSEPEFTVLPSLYYVARRKRFLELFQPLRPPLLYIQHEGYQPTWQDPAAHAIFLLDTLVNEILFAAMAHTYPEMIKEFARLIQHTRHQWHTLDVFRVALLNAGFGEVFAIEVASEVEKALSA